MAELLRCDFGSPAAAQGIDPADLDAMLAASGLLVYDHDVLRGTVTWRPGGVTVFGYPAASLGTPEAWRACLLPEDRARAIATLESGAFGDTRLRAERYRMRDPAGRVLWIEVHGRIFRRDGHAWRVLAIVDDVTDQVETERELRLHSQILDTLADGVTMAREDGTILLVNRAIERMHGWRREELIGRSTHVFSGLTPAEHSRLRNHVQRTVTREGKWQGEVIERRRDGSLLPVRRSMALLHEGEERLWVGTRTDVSALRALEREVLEASELEQQRLARLLHEGLGQDLAGAALLASNLASQAAQLGSPLAGPAAALVEVLSRTVGDCRRLAQGVRGFALASGGLAIGLDTLAHDCEARHGVLCEVACDAEVAARVGAEQAPIVFRAIADAIEAAVAGGPTRLQLTLDADAERLQFVLTDDGGDPFPEDALRRVRYRIGMLYGTLTASQGESGSRELSFTYPLY
ncbi:MAG: PAS domain S-box protein [Proteobacteria bacterium]|nr:PAS domain S-box protein [Pseudomonadota bacterium]